MFWVAFKGYNNGKAISLGTVEQAEAEAYGMHGYPTAAQAQAKPNSVNAVEKTQVNAWIVAANDITGNPVNDARHAAAAAANATGVSSWAAGLAKFLSEIESRGTWVRVAKVVIGGALVIGGLAKITGTGKVIEEAVK